METEGLRKLRSVFCGCSQDTSGEFHDSPSPRRGAASVKAAPAAAPCVSPEGDSVKKAQLSFRVSHELALDLRMCETRSGSRRLPSRSRACALTHGATASQSTRTSASTRRHFQRRDAKTQRRTEKACNSFRVVILRMGAER